MAIFGIHVKFHGGMSRWMEIICIKVADGVIPYPHPESFKTGGNLTSQNDIPRSLRVIGFAKKHWTCPLDCDKRLEFEKVTR